MEAIRQNNEKVIIIKYLNLLSHVILFRGFNRLVIQKQIYRVTQIKMTYLYQGMVHSKIEEKPYDNMAS